MALMKVSQYRRECFVEGSRPSVNTIKKWVDNGDVYGQIIGGIYYVDPDKIVSTNPLVDKVLNRNAA